MSTRGKLWSASVLVTAGVAGVSQVAAAAEVSPGGALDLTISGFLRAEFFGGQVDDSQSDNSFTRSLDFRNDTEVHVLAKVRSEEIGLEYGAMIEFEADTNETFNTDETWIFIRGGWGEFRMGDQNGVVENSIIGGQTIAAGTGGIDGAGPIVTAGFEAFPNDTLDATKISYYTPSFSGFSVGVSYTPTYSNLASSANNGQFIARKDGDVAMDAQNIVEGGLIYDGALGGLDVIASVVGLWGQLRNDAEAPIADGGFGDDTYWNLAAGASIDLFGFRLAGNLVTNRVGDARDNFLTAGVAYGYGPVNASITYGYVFDSNADFEDTSGFKNPSNLVFSADYALAPGLALQGDVSLFDNDATAAESAASDTGDQGWVALGRVLLSF